MIPLYTYPGSTWRTVIQAEQANPSVAVVAIVNPDSGPGNSLDPNYVRGIAQLEAAGITVLGYDHTSYGARPMNQVDSDALHYLSWYHVNGIFFDEMASSVGYVGYYSAVDSYARSLGFTFTAGNAGTLVPASYLGTMTTIVIYEHSGLPNLTSTQTLYPGYTSGNLSIISYGTGEPTTGELRAMEGRVGYVYFTDDRLPNPYGTLPSYFAAEVAIASVTRL